MLDTIASSFQLGESIYQVYNGFEKTASAVTGRLSL